jgi:hypothetical protein
MANANVATGLRPVRHRNGAPYNGATNTYCIDSGDTTAAYIGDAVKSAGGADALGVPTVIQAAAGDTLRGVIVSVRPVTSASTPYREASTTRYVQVADDPDLVFEIQEDAVGGALAATEVGENADLVVAAGSAYTGRSGMQLDSSDHKTATAQLRILGFVQRPDNAIGANAKVLVSINEHELKSTTGL